ncbi:MAG: AarF/UbiB family protein [Anaerolineales bacterium]|nr:AarF/UbiB family protein [Anaerolineales bacterium]
MYRSRYRRITWFFGRVIASLILWDLIIPRLGLGRLSARNRSARMQKSAIRFRRLAVAMGGVMIKVGQFLSTRVDILPAVVTDELAGLQDEVPAVPVEALIRVIEQEFGRSLEQLYLSFDPQPLAAASLGQVHRATLQPQLPARPGSAQTKDMPAPVQVVVKVQRPDIENLIKTDLSALQTVGQWLQRYRPIRRRADVPALLDEFSRILYEEVDYLAEGRNAETFAENFSNDGRVRVPKVYWSHTTVRVLTLENVYAIKITDYNTITQAQISRSQVASVLLDTYLQQIFKDGFFHADPHPGNLFVEPSPLPLVSPAAAPSQTSPTELATEAPPVTWQITFVDFGMVGHVPEHLILGLRELLIGVGTRDSKKVVNGYNQMGILLPDADLAMLERAQSRIFERYWGMNMSELTRLTTVDFQKFMDEFRDLVYDLPFQVPQDLIFLVRCVNILSGICTGLDPKFNVFEHLVPFAQKLVAEEARSNRKDWFSQVETIARGWLSAPLKLDALLARLERGELQMRNPDVSHQISRLEQAVRSLAISLLFTALLISGIQFWLAGVWWGAGILLTGAFTSLIWLLWRLMIPS